MLNKYVWQLYTEAGGQNTIAFFQQNLELGLQDTYGDGIADFQGIYCACSGVVEETRSQLQDFYKDTLQTSIPQEETNSGGDSAGDISTDLDEINTIFQDWYQERISEAEGSDKDLFDWFISSLSYFTTAFAMDFPDLFIPYYFFANYNVLTKIADTFGINMPSLPQKADYRARVWHYAEICKTLRIFRHENELSPSELCAFLYDFAPKYIGGVESYIIKELPEPRSAYFIGGGGDNLDAVAEDNPNEIRFWQSNPGTRAGDMIVMTITDAHISGNRSK